MYVSADGEYEVIKDGKVLGKLGAGKAFGELAILYNCMRTASIKGKRNYLLFYYVQFVFLKSFTVAITAGEVWVLERSVFQQIMMRTGMKKLQEQVFLVKK